MRARRSGVVLAADERLVHHLRTHPKALLGPLLGALMLTVLAAAAMLLLPGEHRATGGVVAGLVVLGGWLAFVVGPLAAWRSRTYTVTDRRIVTRAGVLHRTGHDIRLSKVNAVSSDRSLLDRVLGCGTLTLDTAAEDGVVVLPDIPGVEAVQLSINELQHAAGAAHEQGATR